MKFYARKLAIVCRKGVGLSSSGHSDSKIQKTKITLTKIQLSLLITKHIIQVGSKFTTAASSYDFEPEYKGLSTT